MNEQSMAHPEDQCTGDYAKNLSKPNATETNEANAGGRALSPSSSMSVTSSSANAELEQEGPTLPASEAADVEQTNTASPPPSPPPSPPL
eukprot:CAMPEP_0181314268 /NCGR_PEP_ID=MMETSP1101-20121128/14720_1 /TAXON_ID=46948 /ORGANISM="Rhodomonas abbreviata, Strain Caron Lab Isolate" /LENGTH=89 /DNA_ID=CAMNT_0023421335 /DNA_START=47 /DNA_END=313 /DNA_ORIENTATION=+